MTLGHGPSIYGYWTTGSGASNIQRVIRYTVQNWFDRTIAELISIGDGWQQMVFLLFILYKMLYRFFFGINFYSFISLFKCEINEYDVMMIKNV